MSANLPDIGHAPSFEQLVGDGRHFARRGPAGSTEVVDSIEGKVVLVIGDFKSPQNLEKRILPNGEELWVDKNLPTLASSRNTMPYHPWIIDLICEEIAEGGSLTKICKKPDMPSYTLLSRWRRVHPEIDEMLQRARADRAEYHRDNAMDVVEDADEDNVMARTLQHNAHKWAAGVDDSKFSPKAKIEGNFSAPTQIIVNTGIDRTPLPQPAKETVDVTKDPGS